MIKKTIKFTDYDGNQREEDHYFNLNKAELSSMQLSVNGGLSTMLERAVMTKDNAELSKVFEDMIRLSYGEKSLDGRQFIKKPELFEAFKQTEAYVELYMELISNAEEAAKFINGIMPPEYVEQAKVQMKQLEG